MMRELLIEQLGDYISQFKANKAECVALMKKGEPWTEHAKKGAGLKLMITATLVELKKYTKEDKQ